MRKQPSSPPKIDEQSKDVTTLTRDYELITPLFGGGVTPGETDAVTVIRGTEIRGHLRFWWRACRGGQFSNVAEMKQREDEIWGTAYSKEAPVLSQDKMVQIAVEILKQGEDIKPFNGQREANGIPPYASFPLQPTREELRLPNPPQRYVRKGVSFRLSIAFPQEQQKEIEAALWAWETFGGVGARTRRGFGALRRLNADAKSIPLARNVEGWLRENLARYIEQEHFPEGIPHLSREMHFKVRAARPDSMQAWSDLIKRLKDFRQFDRLGPQKKSVWPEARAIRQLTQGQQASRVFPRAAFGLPIIFHFIGDGPADTTLNEAGEKRERLASPLILRPLACANNLTVGLAAVLEGSRVEKNLELKEKNGRSHQVQATLTKQEASKIDILNGQTDVLQEFLNFL